VISNGRVEGLVVRDDGTPVPEVSVGVIPVTLPAGKQPYSFTTAPEGMTDKDGRFKIGPILPGTYLLAVNPRAYSSSRTPYPTTYFPAGGRDAAVAIDVGDGERKTGYTITITTVK
jgi:hypothetical protein